MTGSRTAIDRDRRALDVARTLGTQEQRQRGDVLRLAEAARVVLDEGLGPQLLDRLAERRRALLAQLFLIGGSVNAAMANFSKGLSKLGNRDDVNVNVIHPGNTDTERQEQLRQQRAAALGKTVEELRAEALVKNNTRRFGKPEDIAALALFLCSERARHIQGAAIAVDGGATPGHY